MLENARELRRRMTLPEVLLWQKLRGKQLLGLRFRRQHVLGPHIADFYCHELRLVVEVDGRAHEAQRAADQSRDVWMDEQGLTVARLPARMILQDITEALNVILRVALRLMPSLRDRLDGVG
ncbi:hypothetical protein PHYC_02340 [Phycisphaerales bacterium]|nr:hypothetical protein PHYC_02340 [Phycisphaerales bacterium]